MNHVEWPAKGKFVPLPGTVAVVSQTKDLLVIEGTLPDRDGERNRRLRAALTADGGEINYLGCRMLYRCEREEMKYNAKKDTYEGTGKWYRRGVGGKRRAIPWLGWLAQDCP